MIVDMSRKDSAGPMLAWLSHPVSLAGLATLLLNDHVLKQAWPGPVTGKLSDLAGMVMFPPLLAVLVALCVPRTPAKPLAVVALCLTGAGFAAVKLVPSLAAAVSQMLSAIVGPSVLRADPTDLLALPALGVAWLAWRRAHHRPIATRAARAVRAGVLIPLALMGTLATSKGTATPPSLVSKSDDDQVWYGRYVSADGGRTFREQTPPGNLTVLTRDCAGQICYRVVPGRLGVESSRDGGQTWSTSWWATSGQRRDLIASESVWDNEDAADGWESLSLAVVPIPGTPEGHSVLLGNGRAGLWLRDAQGAWSRVTLRPRSGGAIEPVPAASLSQGMLPGGEAYFFLTAIVLFLLLGGLGFVALKARAPWRLSQWVVVFAVASTFAITGDVLVVALGEAAHPAEIVTTAVLAAANLCLAAWLFVRYRSVLPIGYLIAMLGIIGLATWWLEDLRLNGRLNPVALCLLLIPFCLCALLGVGARPWPRATIPE